MIPTTTCPNCGHIWTIRVEIPKRCPRCSRRLNPISNRRVLTNAEKKELAFDDDEKEQPITEQPITEQPKEVPIGEEEFKLY